MNAIIFHGLGFGDIYTFCCGVYKLSTIYKKIFLICNLPNNNINYHIKECEQIYKNCNNIEFIEYKIEWNGGNTSNKIKKFLESFKNTDIYWPANLKYHGIEKSNFIKDGYKALNLDMNIRLEIKYSFITFDIEEQLYIEYKKILDKYGIDKYYFCVNKYSKSILNNFNRIYNRDIFVFNPNLQLYKSSHKFYNLSNEVSKFIKEKVCFVKNYKNIIENSSKIFCCDSAFWCFLSLLDLSNVEEIVVVARCEYPKNFCTKSNITFHPFTKIL